MCRTLVKESISDVFKREIIDIEKTCGAIISREDIQSLNYTVDSSGAREWFEIPKCDKVYFCKKHRNGITSIFPFAQTNEFVIIPSEEDKNE